MISSHMLVQGTEILVRFFAQMTVEIVLTRASLVIQKPLHDRICGATGVEGLSGMAPLTLPSAGGIGLLGTLTLHQILFHVNLQTNAMFLLKVTRNFVLSVDHYFLAYCAGVFHLFGWFKAKTVYVLSGGDILVGTSDVLKQFHISFKFL